MFKKCFIDSGGYDSSFQIGPSCGYLVDLGGPN